MVNVSNDIVEYGKKLDILRVYLSYYTSLELEKIFKSNSLYYILENFSYAEIRARLVNARNNIKEEDVGIGSVVTILKPYLKDGAYINLKGVIVGYRVVYTGVSKLESYKIYDILVKVSDSLNNGRYEVIHDVIDNLLVSDSVIYGFNDVLNEYTRYTKVIPV